MRLITYVDNLGKSILEAFFPIRCLGCRRVGEWICKNCEKSLDLLDLQVCPKCQRGSFGGFTHQYCATQYTPERLVSIFPYKGPIKKAIRQFKYGQVVKVTEYITARMVDYFEKYLIYLPSDYVFVPIPLHWRRFWQRSYNQSEIIAEKMAEKLGLSIDSTLIKRKIYTKSQTKLTPSERLRNVKGAFVVPGRVKDRVRGSNIVLVDDVWTSGATALAACRTLKKAKAKNVWILTVARG